MATMLDGKHLSKPIPIKVIRNSGIGDNMC